MSHLEENARLSYELQEALDDLDGYKAQRDTMREELTKALDEIARLRKECDRLHTENQDLKGSK